MPKLCLNMIVKNEAHLIEATLRNIAQHSPIDYWVISDTGSTDGTGAIIERTMASLGIPGQLFHDEWVNFSHNRNLALKHAQDKADYYFFFDADDYIDGHIDWPTDWTADAYQMSLSSESRDISYQRILIVKNRMCQWRGVVHEFVELVEQANLSNIEGDYQVVSCRKGDRSRDAQKYLKDALLLKTALEANQDPDLRSRYLFYCAQSYMDAGMEEESIYWHLERTKENQGWSEEIYVSHLRLGFAYENRQEHDKALYHWLLGAQINPQRAECWYHLSRLNSWEGRPDVAFVFSQKAAQQPLNHDVLFANLDIYNYWCQYEIFVNGCQTNHLKEAYQALKFLIWSDHAPNSLYLDRLNKVALLREQVQQDQYQTVCQLVERLKATGGQAVLDTWGLSAL